MLSHMALLIALTALFSTLRSVSALCPEGNCTAVSPNACEQRQYYANLEAVLNGTTPTHLQGLNWHGWQTTTEIDTIVPQDCPYNNPNDRMTLCHYALAARARSPTLDSLPRLEAASPAVLANLNWFSLATGPSSYFGYPGQNVSVIGLDRASDGSLVDSGQHADYTYSTAFNYGAVGATMMNVTTPKNFTFAGFAFNVTTPGADEPLLLLDDIEITTFSPAACQ